MGWWAVVAPRKADKAAAVLVLTSALRARGVAVGGFLQREVSGPAGESLGWDVEHLVDGARASLARTGSRPDVCDFAFEAEAFATAAAWASLPCEVAVVASLGRMEADRRGHFPVLERLVRAPDGPEVLAVVRDSCLSPVGLALPDALGWLEWPADEAAVQAFADTLAAAVRSRRG